MTEEQQELPLSIPDMIMEALIEPKIEGTAVVRRGDTIVYEEDSAE